jgi:MFS family permease
MASSTQLASQLEAAAPGPPAGRPPAWRRGERATLGVMTTSHAVQHVYVAGIALTYPFVVAQFHISYAVLGVVLTVAGVVGGALQGAAGLIRRASARALLAAQNLLLAAASLLGAIAPGFAAYGAARCFGSLVSWPQHPVGSAYLSERFPTRRGTVLSWHTSGGSLGTVLTPLAVAAMISAWGWRWALVVLAVPMAAGGLLVGLRLPDDRQPRGQDEPGSQHRDQHQRAGAKPALAAADRAGPGGGLEAWRQLASALARPAIALTLVASTISAAGRGLGVLAAYVPAYLKSGLHLGTFRVGVIYTVLMVGGVVGPVVAGHLSDRVGRLPVLLSAYLGGAAALVALPLVGDKLGPLLVMAAVVGVLAYIESPLLQALFSDAIADLEGRAAFGVFFAIAYGVGALWLAVIGWVIDQAGFNWAFYVMAASFVLAAGVVVPLGPILRKPPPGQPAGSS